MKRMMLLASVAQFALLATPGFAQNAALPEEAKSGDSSIKDKAAVQKKVLPETANATPSDAPAAQADAPAADAAARDIIVTGYRASLGSAQQIKRNSDAILDAVVAEDIGKLPDNNASESIARVTGVQVNRSSDEANQVIVRGLPNVVTTFNGRDIYTADSRSSALQDFPAGSLAGLEVYKSGTADLVEPGLAGLINVRSRRPFDFTEKFVVAGAVRGTYNDQSRKFDPQGNILVSQRFETPIGEIGWLVNASYTQSQYRNAVRYASGFVTSPGGGNSVSPASVGTNFRIPEAVGLYMDSGKRWRPAVTASVQWKPASNLEVYSDFLYQGYRGLSFNDSFNGSLLANNASLTNVVLTTDHPDQVASLTKVGGFRPEGTRFADNVRTNTYQAAGGIKWNIGRARLSTDLAYTSSTVTGDASGFDMALSSAPTFTVNFQDAGGAAFNLPGFKNDDPSNYIWRGYYNRRFLNSGRGWQWRADLDLDTNVSLLPKLQFGVRYTDRNAINQFGDRYVYAEPLGLGLNAPPAGGLQLTQSTFRGDAQGFTSFLMPTRDGIANNAEALRQYSVQALQQLVALNPGNTFFSDNLARFQSPQVQFDPLRAFYGSEKTYTFYGQTKYRFDVGDWQVDGLIGARVVNTVGLYNGINVVTFGGVTAQVPRTIRQNYVDVLPNVSLRIRPSSKLQVRFAFTETRTKPEFNQLNPAINISQNTAAIVPNQPLDTRFPAALGGRPNAYGYGGNPDLAPLTSKNYDATVEYYFSKTGSVSAAIFYRDLYGFISNYTTRTIDPVYGLIEINRPENSGAAKIKGFEIGGQTFLDFLPGFFSGFGVQANATYLDGQQRFPQAIFAAVTGTTAQAPFVPIPALSKWSYNAALFYEKGKISTRLSYNGRSAFLNNNFVNNAGVYVGEGTYKITRLDFSFNYTPVKQVTLTVDVANLLAQPFRNYADYDYNGERRSYPRDVRDEGRYFGMGARFRF